MVEGWYRRCPVPYVEIRRLDCDGVTRRSWTPLMNKLSAIALIGVGLTWVVWASGLDMWIKTNVHF